MVLLGNEYLFKETGRDISSLNKTPQIDWILCAGYCGILFFSAYTEAAPIFMYIQSFYINM